MTGDQRLELMCAWNSMAVFGSVMFLDGGLAKAALVTLLVFISCLIGWGRRWLLRGGFALTMVAVAVAFGFPHPAQWPSLVKNLPSAIADAHTAYFSQASTAGRN